jgi:hypothetical protein
VVNVVYEVIVYVVNAVYVNSAGAIPKLLALLQRTGGATSYMKRGKRRICNVVKVVYAVNVVYVVNVVYGNGAGAIPKLLALLQRPPPVDVFVCT